MSNALNITVPGSRSCIHAPPSGLQRRKYQRYAKSHSTYLGLIACVIQQSPNKRLTFCQIMDSLEPFVSGDRRGLVNNIRVCLSSNDCFVKVPVHPEYPNSKINFWKVDETRITPKMLRRHFKGMMDTFPDLASSLQRGCDTTKEMYRTHNPQKPNIPAIHNGCATKFSGPFSIESILKKETCSRRIPKSSVLCTLPGTLDGHDQDLKRTQTAFGIKRKSGLEDRGCGPADSRSEFRGYMNEQANSVLSTNRYTSEYSTPEIRRVPECHEKIRPANRTRMCPDLPDTMFPRQVIECHVQRAIKFNFPNNLLYPLNAHHFNQWNFGL